MLHRDTNKWCNMDTTKYLDKYQNKNSWTTWTSTKTRAQLQRVHPPTVTSGAALTWSYASPTPPPTPLHGRETTPSPPPPQHAAYTPPPRCPHAGHAASTPPPRRPHAAPSCLQPQRRLHASLCTYTRTQAAKPKPSRRPASQEPACRPTRGDMGRGAARGRRLGCWQGVSSGWGGWPGDGLGGGGGPA